MCTPRDSLMIKIEVCWSLCPQASTPPKQKLCGLIWYCANALCNTATGVCCEPKRFCFRLFDAHARESTRLLLLVCCGLTYMMWSDLIQCSLPRNNMVLSTLSIYNLSIIYLSFFLSYSLSIFLSFYNSLRFISTSLYLCPSQSIYPTIYLSTYLSICLSICLSTNLSTAWVLHKTSLYKNLRGSSPRRATYFQLYQTHSTLRIWGTLE